MDGLQVMHGYPGREFVINVVPPRDASHGVGVLLLQPLEERMHSMNGLTSGELTELERQLARTEEYVRILLEREIGPRYAGGKRPAGYRERVDDEAIPGALNDADTALVVACARISDAIERSRASMHAGTYGACSTCGRHIGLKRLRLFPAAIQCTDCDSKRLNGASSR